MITRIKTLWVGEEKTSLYDEGGYEISICDEDCGEFVEVKELGPNNRSIFIYVSDWPHLNNAINQMINSCREEE